MNLKIYFYNIRANKCFIISHIKNFKPYNKMNTVAYVSKRGFPVAWKLDVMRKTLGRLGIWKPTDSLKQVSNLTQQKLCSHSVIA